MVLKLSVDRIDNGIAVCYDDGCQKHELPARGLSEGDMISAEFNECGKLISVKVLKDETERRRSDLASRTKNLFNRNKK